MVKCYFVTIKIMGQSPFSTV